VRDAIIKEFRNGKCQIWKGNKVLRPKFFEWLGKHQAQHDFMFFDSIEDAKQAIKDYSSFEKGNECIKIHEV
jgi:hypothetical protein